MTPGCAGTCESGAAAQVCDTVAPAAARARRKSTPSECLAAARPAPGQNPEAGSYRRTPGPAIALGFPEACTTRLREAAACKTCHGRPVQAVRPEYRRKR